MVIYLAKPLCGIRNRSSAQASQKNNLLERHYQTKPPLQPRFCFFQFTWSTTSDPTGKFSIFSNMLFFFFLRQIFQICHRLLVCSPTVYSFLIFLIFFWDQVRVRGFEQLWSKNWWSYLTPQRKRRTRRPLTECRPVGPRCRDVSTP